MQPTLPFNDTINKGLKQNAEALLFENGVSPEEALTFLYQNIAVRDFDIIGIETPNQNNA